MNIEFSSVMPGGNDTMSCILPWAEVSSHRNTYRPNAQVTVKDSARGTELWQGFLKYVTPAQDGTAKLDANGWFHVLQEWEEPLLWQSRLYDDWGDGSADPFDFKESDAIDLNVTGGALKWKVGKGTEIKGGGQPDGQVDRARAMWFYDGLEVKRLAGKVKLPRSNGQYSFRVEKFGSLSENAAVNITGLSLSTSGTYTFQVQLGQASDIIGFCLWRSGTSDTSTAVPFLIQVVNLRVNGTAYRSLPGTAGAANWDTYPADEVVRDICAKVNFATTQVEGSDTHASVLPLFWRSGSLYDLLDYLATLENKKWAVWPGKVVEFRGWNQNNTTWSVSGFGTDAHALVDIEPVNDVYSHIEVRYQLTNGKWKTYTKSTGANLGSNRRRTFQYELADAFPKPATGKTPDFVKAVANALADEYGTTRWAGTIRTAQVRTTAGVTVDAYRARPGHVINVEDWPDDLPADNHFRIYEAQYDEDGVTFTIGRTPAKLERLLLKREKKRSRGAIG